MYVCVSKLCMHLPVFMNILAYYVFVYMCI
jgi:hypothetical protein